MNSTKKIIDFINQNELIYCNKTRTIYFKDNKSGLSFSETDFNLYSFKKYVDGHTSDYYDYLKSLSIDSIPLLDTNKKIYDFNYSVNSLRYGIFANRNYGSYIYQRYLSLYLTQYNKSEINFKNPTKYHLKYRSYISYSYGANITVVGFITYVVNNTEYTIKINTDNASYNPGNGYNITLAIKQPFQILEYQYNNVNHNIALVKDIRSKSGALMLFNDNDSDFTKVLYFNNKDYISSPITDDQTNYNGGYADVFLKAENEFVYFISVNRSTIDNDQSNTTYFYKINVETKSIDSINQISSSDLIIYDEGESYTKIPMTLTHKVTALSSESLEGRILFFIVKDSNNNYYLKSSILSIDYTNLSITRQPISLSEKTLLDVTEHNGASNELTILDSNVVNDENGVISVTIYNSNSGTVQLLLYQLSSDKSTLNLKDHIIINTIAYSPIIIPKSIDQLVIYDQSYVYTISIDYDNLKYIKDVFQYKSFRDDTDRPLSIGIWNSYLIRLKLVENSRLLPYRIDQGEYSVELIWDQDTYTVYSVPFIVSGTLYIKDSQGNNVNGQVELYIDGGAILNQNHVIYDVENTGKHIEITVTDPDIFKVNTFVTVNNT